MTISRRFVGPPDSGHGGYACGLVATPLGPGPTQVTLRRPPPVGRPLQLSPEPDGVTLLDGEHLVAEAVLAPPFPDADRPPSASREEAGEPAATPDAAAASGERPAAVSWEEAETLAATFDVDRYEAQHWFPGCFACGPHRAPGDGLRLFPASSGPDRTAWPWSPDPSLGDADGLVEPIFLWAALDCPTGLVWYHEDPPVPAHVMGRMTAVVQRRPRVGDRLVVGAWAISAEGRKRVAGSVVWDDTGEVLAESRATWIKLDEQQQSQFRSAQP